jgi:hypothetical protein
VIYNKKQKKRFYELCSNASYDVRTMIFVRFSARKTQEKKNFCKRKIRSMLTSHPKNYSDVKKSIDMKFDLEILSSSEKCDIYDNFLELQQTRIATTELQQNSGWGALFSVKCDLCIRHGIKDHIDNMGKSKTNSFIDVRFGQFHSSFIQI